MSTSSPEMLGKWVVGRVLGEGGFSEVRLGEHKKTGEKVALKILEIKSGDTVNSLERKQVESEINAMKKIQHKNVIQMKDFDLTMTFRKKNVILVVLELASGGELFEYLSFTGAFEEPIARSYFHQLMEGLHAAHSKRIVHRDLKPENLLMDSKFQLKIADFGFAHTMKSSNLYTECGTTGYMAPEMFNTKSKGYDGYLTDVWACGVILFIMIAGFPPYQKPSKTDWWFDKLVKKKYDRFWAAHCRTAYFSDSAKDLINKMFNVRPEGRISVGDIMKSRWYAGDILSESELTKTLAARKKIVDKENLKLRESKRADQLAAGFSAGTCRAIGDDEPTEEDAADDELPEGGPASIIMKIPEVDDTKEDYDTKEDEEDDDAVVDMSTGGMMMGGSGLMSGGSGSPAAELKTKAAPAYNPVVQNLCKFSCDLTPAELYSELKEIFDKKSYKTISEDEYTIQLKVSAVGGVVKFGASVFAYPDDAKKSIVEFNRRGGANTTLFRSVYATIRNSMKTKIVDFPSEDDSKDDSKCETKVESKVESKDSTVSEVSTSVSALSTKDSATATTTTTTTTVSSTADDG